MKSSEVVLAALVDAGWSILEGPPVTFVWDRAVDVADVTALFQPYGLALRR